ncbi:hypothetical protein V500_01585 [Pseudogymnoascus sp. VKM F-4518 (FW-2643)]|nr:hypothetical protein V500_01585 [Pseudogymnoascus sp. VKM F-4518 (FW-2643)]
MSNEQLKQSEKTTDGYRPLDTSRSEIRLLSFETTATHGPIRLNLHYASLNDWKPDYVSFRDQNSSSLSSSQLSEAWGDRFATAELEMKDTVTRFTWGDYICLSYTWGDCAGQKATIFLDGIATAVSKHLEAALEDLRETLECKLGMKVWADALCINQADIVDRNSHVIRVKDIFGGAFSVIAWTKEHEDLKVLGLRKPGERLVLCEVIFRKYGRRALEELLGARDRSWGAAEDEDEQLMELVEDVDELVFDQYYYADSDDDDKLGFGRLHLRDIVRVELSFMFRKGVLVSTVGYPGADSQPYDIDRDILVTLSESRQSSNSEIWEELRPRLDLLALITLWRTLEPGDIESSLNNAFIRELKLLAQRANCSSPHDKVYGLLGLFPASVSCAITIDYSREHDDVIAEFASTVSVWLNDRS